MNKDINIKYMTDSAYATLFSNPLTFSKLIQENEFSNKWLTDKLGKNCFEDRIYRIKDFELKTSKTGKYSEVEFENAVLLYDSLKTLPRYVLFDERFWAWIVFSKCYKVSVQAMPLKFKNTFKNTWFISGKTKRDKISRNAIARSYFWTEITATDDGNYELTKFVFEKHDRIRNLFFDNKSKHVIHNIVRAEKALYDRYSNDEEYKDALKKCESGLQNVNIYTYIRKYMSLYGSVRDLDLISSDDLFNVAFAELEKVINNVKEGNIEILLK